MNTTDKIATFGITGIVGIIIGGFAAKYFENPAIFYGFLLIGGIYLIVALYLILYVLFTKRKGETPDEN